MLFLDRWKIAIVVHTSMYSMQCCNFAHTIDVVSHSAVIFALKLDIDKQFITQSQIGNEFHLCEERVTGDYRTIE